VTAQLEVHYSDAVASDLLCADSERLLGVIGYGAERPAFLDSACPFVAAPLLPAAETPMLEIWTTNSKCRPSQVGTVTGAQSDQLAFGMVKVDDTGTNSLEAAVEIAYLAIFDFIDQIGFQSPIRFWNYLTSITENDQGLERYMRFNIGRQRAFANRLRDQVPPAASGVGGHQGESIIYFLAARKSPVGIENPRQVRAFDYPPIYGPESPSFSRASLYRQGGGEVLFISGTASIVGHETFHRGDLLRQISETAENLRAVITTAERTTSMPPGNDWAVKIYLQSPAYLGAIEKTIDSVFGEDSQRLYLRGDICRKDLLVEVEAFRRFDIDSSRRRTLEVLRQN